MYGLMISNITGTIYDGTLVNSSAANREEVLLMHELHSILKEQHVFLCLMVDNTSKFTKNF